MRQLEQWFVQERYINRTMNGVTDAALTENVIQQMKTLTNSKNVHFLLNKR